MALLEIMVVITLIALVTATIGVSVFHVLEDGQEKTARQQMAAIQNGLDVFRLQYGAYPPTSDGISALTRPARGRPFLDKEPRDPWGNAFRYAFPGVRGGPVDLWSAGKDGVDGTDDDIGNWP